MQSCYFYNDPYQNHPEEGCFLLVARTLCIPRMRIIICRDVLARTLKDIIEKQFIIACSFIFLSTKIQTLMKTFYFFGYYIFIMAMIKIANRRVR